MEVENVGIEVEGIPRAHGEAIQMRDAEYEGAGPVGKPAWGRSKGGARLEEACVNLRRDGVTKHGPEGAAHHVGTFSAGKVQRIEGTKMKTEAVELEGSHCFGGITLGDLWSFLLLYNSRAFDSSFPLRTKLRGLRESFRTPSSCFGARSAG